MAKKTNQQPVPVLLQGTQEEEYDEQVPSREDLLKLIRAHKKGCSFEQIIEHFNLQRASAQTGVYRRLEAMERDSQLQQINNNTHSIWRALKTDVSMISGKVQGHRDGYGFLIPNNPKAEDIYLSPKQMLKVLHGDQVLVKPVSQRGGKIEGAIIEVLERSTQTLVGRLLHEQDYFIVAPEDQRIKHDIIVSPNDLSGAEHGQVVVVELIQQPTRQTHPQGKIIEVLGDLDDPGMEIEIAVRKFKVPHLFSEETLKRTENLPKSVRKSDLKDRVDLRDIPFITIDGEDARDFDDAVYAEMVDWPQKGKKSVSACRLLVAIADVSHYVKPKTALDKDAQSRGVSVYFPRRVIPMLPQQLSNGICSLMPNEDRLVLVCDMVIPLEGDNKGQVQAYQFYPGVICSQARTTYTQIWDVLQQPEGQTAQELNTLLPSIFQLYALYQVLAERRTERGAIEFDTVETQIIFNDWGKIEQIVPTQRNDAHRLIEECMLVANTCAADMIERYRKEALYRVHEGPTPVKLTALKEYLNGTGLFLEGGDEPSSLDYAKLINDARAREDFQVIQSMVMRSMQQAIYTPENSGHFGLSYQAYTHFTSPIRRYPDLMVHRVIKGILTNKDYTPYIDGLKKAKNESAKEFAHAVWEQLGVVLSAHERRADDASYDVLAWLKCWFMRERVGDVFSGTISGVTHFGVFVTLDGLYVEGLVHISELDTDYYQYIDNKHELVGERTGQRFRLGDKIQVQVAKVDLEARKIDFTPVTSMSFEKVKKDIVKGEKEPVKHYKKAAKPKPKGLKGTASERRATQRQAEKDTRKAKAKSARPGRQKKQAKKK